MSRLTFVLISLLSTVAIADEDAIFDSLLLEGDDVGKAGLVQFIENLAVNDSGRWVVECNTDFTNTDQDGALVKNGQVFLREGIVGQIDAPPNTFVDIFDSVNLNNNSNSGINLFIDPLPLDQDSGIYLNEMLLIQESDFATAPELSPGTPYIGFFDTKINNNDVMMIMASVDDPEIPSTVDRALVLLDTASGNQSVVAKEDDILPGQTELVDDFGTGPHSSAINDHGDVMYIAELSGDSAVDNAIYINQQLMAQEGFASPIKGRPYEFLADRALDINNVGDYVFKANLTGDSASDDVLIVNGEIFKQEGDPAPGGFAFTGFGSNSGPIRIGNNGKVVWYGEWDDPDTNVNSGLFVGENLVVQAGVTTIDGVVVESISDVQDSFAVSSSGRWIVFEGSLVGGINGAFRIRYIIRGDINGDGVVDLLDVDPFIDALLEFPPPEADVNCDGVVDLLDIPAFIEALVDG